MSKELELPIIMDMHKVLSRKRNYYPMLNEQQKAAYHDITFALDHPHCYNLNKMFFIEGPAGVGKTFLLNTILGYCQSRSKKFLSCAFTGIGSCLLKDGRTVHSRFQLPWTNGPIKSQMNIYTNAANEIRQAQIIVWDQVTMCRKNVIEAVDALLREIMGNYFMFGGKVVVFAGDFRECLPIIRYKRSEQQLVHESFKFAETIYPYTRKITLFENMRLLHDADYEFLLKIGYGDETQLKLPKHLLVHTFNDLIDDIYGHKIPGLKIQDVKNKTILSTLKSAVEDINYECLTRMDADAFEYFSHDIITQSQQKDKRNFYRKRYLQKFLPSSFPPEYLELKLNCPIILNYNYMGLKQGTRLIVTKFSQNYIKAKVACGNLVGKQVLIMKMQSVYVIPHLNIKFVRYQFPVSLCFAMTINKSQGQTFEHLGLYLPEPLFSHGQLYVIMSRCRELDNLRVHIAHPDDDDCFACIKNIVYKSIFKDS